MLYVFLAHGFEEIEALTVVDLLRRAEIQVKTVSLMEDKVVYGAHGIGVESDILFRYMEPERCEMFVLPGGMPGTVNLCNHKAFNEELKNFAASGKPVAAICAAPMVFAKAGLFDGHRATIYPGMEDELVNAVSTGEKVVVDDRIITGRGPGVAIDFALAIIEYLAGKERAEEVKNGLQG
ncbi:MAG: DJ-1/PfpI family protein [Eubacteriaceae bacterium]|nr:DJ-1/PfpI family protein [Eubacteriaceae bacterium]